MPLQVHDGPKGARYGAPVARFASHTGFAAPVSASPAARGRVARTGTASVSPAARHRPGFRVSNVINLAEFKTKFWQSGKVTETLPRA